MARAKQASKRRRQKKALPVMGIAGVSLSLSLAGGAYASTGGSTTDIRSQNISPRQIGRASCRERV